MKVRKLFALVLVVFVALGVFASIAFAEDEGAVTLVLDSDPIIRDAVGVRGSRVRRDEDVATLKEEGRIVAYTIPLNLLTIELEEGTRYYERSGLDVEDMGVFGEVRGENDPKRPAGKYHITGFKEFRQGDRGRKSFFLEAGLPKGYVEITPEKDVLVSVHVDYLFQDGRTRRYGWLPACSVEELVTRIAEANGGFEVILPRKPVPTPRATPEPMSTPAPKPSNPAAYPGPTMPDKTPRGDLPPAVRMPHDGNPPSEYPPVVESPMAPHPYTTDCGRGDLPPVWDENAPGHSSPWSD